MSNLEATFKLEHLHFYKILREPGTYFCTCAANIKYSSLYTKDEKHRWIIPLRVLPENNIPALLEIFKDGDFEVPFKKVSNLFLSGVVWENTIKDPSELPIKGEQLICNFEFIGDRLLCTNIQIPPRIELDVFSISDYLDLKVKLHTLLHS